MYDPGPGNQRSSLYLQNEETFKHRTYDAVVTSINTATGIAKVAVQGFPDPKEVQIAGAGGLSFPIAGGQVNGNRGSWRRYMPEVDAGIAVNFTADGACRFQSFHAPREVLDADTSASGQRNLGYAWYQQRANRAEYGLRPFVELSPGEWQDRSRGGAEVYGRANGTLELVGGITRIAIRKNDEKILGEANTYLLSDRVATRLEFGVVPGTSDPTSVSPSAPESDAPNGSPRRMFRMWIGPRSSLNQTAMAPNPTPTNDATSQPPQLHARLEMGETDEELENSPVRSLSVGYDASGLQETYGHRASVLGDWQTKNLAITVTATAAGTYTINAPQVSLGVGVRQPAVLGQTLLSLLSALTVPTAFGPSGPPINATQFNQFLSQIVELS